MRLFENPTLEFPGVRNAREFAKAKHDATGAVRRFSKEPYFSHPDAVADLVAAYDGTEEQIVAALLHDTVEDADTSISEIEQRFGSSVAQIVSELTNYRPDVQRLGKELYIDKELCEMSDEALLVKCADCVENYLDHPTAAQKQRLVNNLECLIANRENLPRNVKQLLKGIPELNVRSDILDTNECRSYQELVEDTFVEDSKLEKKLRRFFEMTHSLMLKTLADSLRKEKTFVAIAAGDFDGYLEAVTDYGYDKATDTLYLFCDAENAPISVKTLFAESHKHPIATIALVHEELEMIVDVEGYRIEKGDPNFGEENRVVLF